MILAIQNNSYSTPQFNAYVSSGGLAILQDWTRDSTRGSTAGVFCTSQLLFDERHLLPVPDRSVLDHAVVLEPWLGTYTMGMSTAATSAATLSGLTAIATNSDKVIVNGFLTDTFGHRRRPPPERDRLPAGRSV